MPGVTLAFFSATSVMRLMAMPGCTSTKSEAWPSMGR
jgi:hypothetical protein